VRKVFFTDTEFNIPNLQYSSSLLQRIIQSGLSDRFRFFSQFLPAPFDEAYANLLAKAGFSVILTCDSFADDVLDTTGASYRQTDIINTLKLCDVFAINCTVNLIFGLPGDTERTIDHTLAMIHKYPPSPLRHYEYTFGGRIYQGTQLCRFTENGQNHRYLYGVRSSGYLEPYYFCVPHDPLTLKNYVTDALPFQTEFSDIKDPTKQSKLAMAYLLDSQFFGEAAALFARSGIPAQTSIYEYMFRKLAEAGETALARSLSHKLIETILQYDTAGDYKGQIPLIQFYLSLLGES
jgi:hypothetical protein